MNIHPSKASPQYSALHPAGREVNAVLHPPEAAGAASGFWPEWGNSGHSRPGSCGPARWQGRDDPLKFDLF
jgi:hypothetical protein